MPTNGELKTPAIETSGSTLIGRAYEFAKKAHAGQKRKSGEPYITHPLAVAETLRAWHLDEASIIAGLLHDVVEDTGVPLQEIQKKFGDEVAFLVDGVTKLNRIKYHGAEETKAENLRKMMFAVSRDLRVIFVKLADRLHNMRTLSALPPAKQKRIALETDEIYAPIAYRLGMQNLNGELHDLAFPYLNPDKYLWLKGLAEAQYESRLAYLKKIKPLVEGELRAHHIEPAAIDFRAKRMSSLYKKLLGHEMDIDKIYDLVAFRIIVKTVEDCYTALGIIHQLWPPLPGRIKDYVAMPKPNGYRSLHTTVFGPEGKNVEFQIRTQEMHEENENGIAAHWVYEQKKEGGASAQKITEEIRWVQQLRNWAHAHLTPEANPEQFLESMKVDFFKDRIFVISPKGDVFDLPAESTPVDFAYHIHSEVGDSGVAAKVNNQFVPLDHRLHSGDIVEVITQKNKKPSEDWLKFVKTSVARDRIRAALRAKNKRLRGEKTSKTELKIVVENRPGILKDIQGIIAQSHFNIAGINTDQSGRLLIMRIQLETSDKQKVEKLILKIKKLKEVKEIGYRLV